MPKLYIIAGCNGAGKTTVAKTLLPDYLNCTEFVNADILAEEIAPGAVKTVAVKAGRMTLGLMQNLFANNRDFAVETTLSGKLHKKITMKAQYLGYFVTLIYVWIDSPRVSVERVKDRVKLGGHHVSVEDIRRRYARGLGNLFDIYMDVCDYWAIIDNTNPPQKLVASGSNSIDFEIHNDEIWNRVKATYNALKSRA